jgi:hypothetical protein
MKTSGQKLKEASPYLATSTFVTANVMSIVSYFVDLPDEVVGSISSLLFLIINVLLIYLFGGNVDSYLQSNGRNKTDSIIE